MNAKGRPIKLNGKIYNMVYTSAAMLEVFDKYGDVSGMAEKLDENKKESARIIPWLVSLLCNQGIMLETGNTKPNNPDLITPEQVALYTMPKDWQEMLSDAMEAIAIGNGTYHESEEGPVDVVLEELEKNADSGEV